MNKLVMFIWLIIVLLKFYQPDMKPLCLGFSYVSTHFICQSAFSAPVRNLETIRIIQNKKALFRSISKVNNSLMKTEYS